MSVFKKLINLAPESINVALGENTKMVQYEQGNKKITIWSIDSQLDLFNYFPSCKFNTIELNEVKRLKINNTVKDLEAVKEVLNYANNINTHEEDIDDTQLVNYAVCASGMMHITDRFSLLAIPCYIPEGIYGLLELELMTICQTYSIKTSQKLEAYWSAKNKKPIEVVCRFTKGEYIIEVCSTYQSIPNVTPLSQGLEYEAIVDYDMGYFEDRYEHYRKLKKQVEVRKKMYVGSMDFGDYDELSDINSAKLQEWLNSYQRRHPWAKYRNFGSRETFMRLSQNSFEIFTKAHQNEEFKPENVEINVDLDELIYKEPKLFFLSSQVCEVLYHYAKGKVGLFTIYRAFNKPNVFKVGHLIFFSYDLYE